jgi:Periplasmic copper-binding protein (NosD)
MKRSRRTLLRTFFACGLVAAGLMVQAGAASASAHHSMLFVSPGGSSGKAGRSCETARYSTIQSAVHAAPAWSTVVACPGTYSEDVIISSPLRLVGRDAVIKGTSTANGSCDQIGPSGPGVAPCLAGVTIKSSHVEVDGFTVEDAVGEGILATGSLAHGPIHDVSIGDNRVIGNNTGGIPPSPNSPYPQCAANGQIPGDCGEGIHLMGVYDSTVSGNYVKGNEGGVLLTDEFGPTHDNLVERNVVTRNPFDCGVTVPGHNPGALDAQGHRQPKVAGVFDNVIRGNWITDNGLQGEGAGVLFANAGPGTGSYDNLVVDNYIAGNELSGVTMHAHTLPPGMFEDMNGNRVIRNVIGKNNVGSPKVGPGDSLDGQPPFVDPFTTGILVFSGTVPVHATIARNRIFDDHYGVWLGAGSNVTAKIRRNTFDDVTVPVFTQF